jgi:hypothetical protein
VQRLRDQGALAGREQRSEPRYSVERRAQEATQRRNAAEARSNALDRQWNDNEKRIAETQALLTDKQGNLGELFGVTRQVAGDAATVLSQSLVTTRYAAPTEGEDRAAFLRRIGRHGAAVDRRLERLWYEILREMTDAGKVAKYRAAVSPLDDPTTADVDESQTAEERRRARGSVCCQQRRRVPRLSAEQEAAIRALAASSANSGTSAAACNRLPRTRDINERSSIRPAARC